MTIRELVARGAYIIGRAGIPEARREAESLLAHELGKDEAWIVAHADDPVTAAKAKSYARSAFRRSHHEPFAFIIGAKEFYGRLFRLTDDVLIPRPETEILVEAILARAPEDATILDVGTGSGAVGLTLAAERPSSKVILYDVSRKALAVARGNARRLKLGRRVRTAALDILRQPLPEPRGPAIVAANLPYLPTVIWKKAAPEVRLHEPRLALVSGKDGLDHYRALFKRLARWKKPPILLALEAEPQQFKELRRLTLGLTPDARVEILKDLHGDDRVLIAG